MKTIIFACVHNVGRSQMAGAFFNALSGNKEFRAVSAGTEPADKIHPEVVSVMKEVGIDLSSTKPQKLSDDLAMNAFILVTMGCGDACPHIIGLRREDWPLKDPKGLPLVEVRAIRDEIKVRVKKLLSELESRN